MGKVKSVRERWFRFLEMKIRRVSYLNQVIRIGLTQKMMLQQRLGGGGFKSQESICRNIIPDDGRDGVKTLR